MAQAPRPSTEVVAQAEAQWLFTEAELAHTPSIQDGMPQKEEEELRGKGINFIVQVGILLKLPQLTLSTAGVFFQRFLMRASLKKSKNGIPKLHQYQAAATALFLATKVEESCRKMRELVQACCRIAQKNPNLMVDEQSKDFWRWRDCILDNEDVLLEILCFDLTIESPHRLIFDMLKYFKLEHNKPVRNAAWSFVTDSNNTQLCLLMSSRTIAAAALYAACNFCNVDIPPDQRDRYWWEILHVKLSDIAFTVTYMTKHFDAMQANGMSQGYASAAASPSGQSIYTNLKPPGTKTSTNGSTRSPSQSISQLGAPGGASDRRSSTGSIAGQKRPHGTANGHSDEASKRPRIDGPEPNTAVGRDHSASHNIKHEEEAQRVKSGDAHALTVAQAAEGMEEGELQE